jgi:hypothetical protein
VFVVEEQHEEGQAMDGRRRHAVTAGRIGLFVVAVGTAWGAVTAAGGGSAHDVVLVAAPAVAATNARPVSSPVPAQPSVRPVAPARVSRDELRTPLRLPHRPATPAGRHVAR